MNTEDIFRRWHKTMADLKEEIQTLKIQREEVLTDQSEWVWSGGSQEVVVFTGVLV